MSKDIRAFTILGKPKPKERPRLNKSTGQVYTPKDTAHYEKFVQICYKQQNTGAKPFAKGVPLVVRIDTYHAIPKKANKKEREQMQAKGILPTTRPDVDNVIKAILDALNGITYHDDSQVVELDVKKFYCSNPRVWVQIQEAKHEQ